MKNYPKEFDGAIVYRFMDLVRLVTDLMEKFEDLPDCVCADIMVALKPPVRCNGEVKIDCGIMIPSDN